MLWKDTYTEKWLREADYTVTNNNWYSKRNNDTVTKSFCRVSVKIYNHYVRPCNCKSIKLDSMRREALLWSYFCDVWRVLCAAECFSAIGKIIEGSGGPYILSESGAIATGSLPQFFKRKMYYSCRRIHTLLSAAFHGLHIQQFIVETCENSYEEINNALKEWNNQKHLKLTM